MLDLPIGQAYNPDVTDVTGHGRSPNAITSFHKLLPHNQLGEVDLNAYNAMLRALNSGLASDFEAIPLGGTGKLANPQASYCFAMAGADAQAIASPAAPAFSSAQTA